MGTPGSPCGSRSHGRRTGCRRFRGALVLASSNDAYMIGADQSAPTPANRSMLGAAASLVAQFSRHLLQESTLVSRQAGHALLRDLVEDAIHLRGVLFRRLLSRNVLQWLALPQHSGIAARDYFVYTARTIAHRRPVARNGSGHVFRLVRGRRYPTPHSIDSTH